MNQFAKIYQSSLHGTIIVPPSKSHTMRSLLFAGMACGVSKIDRLLYSPDTFAMIQGLKMLGVKIDIEEKSQAEERGDTTIAPADSTIFSATIEGIGKEGGGIIIESAQKLNEAILNVGNSGQVLRFLMPFFAMQEEPITITGDHSIQTLRSIAPLAKALQMIGGEIRYRSRDGFAPFEISGKLRSGNIKIDGKDSQPISALLMSLPFLSEGTSQIEIFSMHEKPWIFFTLWWLRKVQIPYFYDTQKDLFELYGGSTVAPFSYTIPSDMSSLAFPLALASLTDSDCSIPIESMDDPQGDICIVDILQKMGANIEYNPEKKHLHIVGGSPLKGIDVDMDNAIDLLPILAVIASFANGKTCLYNAFSARHKESDRIAKIAHTLSSVGIRVHESEDSLCIYGDSFGPKLQQDIVFDTALDHRIAMSQIVLSAALRESSQFSASIGPIESISKSFPNFFTTLGKSGLQYEFIA